MGAHGVSVGLHSSPIDGIPMSCPRVVRGMSVGWWVPDELSMGYPWGPHGSPMGRLDVQVGSRTVVGVISCWNCFVDFLAYPWASHGQPTGDSWATQHTPMSCSWVVRGSPKRCPWVIRGAPMGCPWSVRGVPMGFPRVARRLSVGSPRAHQYIHKTILYKLKSDTRWVPHGS